MISRNVLLRVFWVASLTGTILGCVTTPDHDPALLDLDTPGTWTSTAGYAATASQNWLADFDDPVLSTLVDDAMGGNFDLRAAAARVDAARGRANIDAADLYPQLSARLDASRTKRNSTGNFAIRSAVTNNFGIGLNSSWEADIWGKLRNQARAGLIDSEATAADYNAARLSLAANIAQAWFNAVEAKLQVELAALTVRSYRNNLATIETGFRNGISDALEVRLARANVAGAEGRWEARKVLLDETVRTLEVLLGRYPSFSLELADKLPVINRDVPPGLPSELLERRPDVRAAELRFVATDERVKQARKNLLPSISLTVNGGTSTDEFRKMLDGDFLVWNIASNLATPIFQGGRLRAQVDVSLAEQAGALADYAQIALQAFQEVESALTAERLLVEQEIALQTAATESVEAEQLATEQYRAGLVDIITLLDTQRRSFDAQSALIETSNQRLQNRVGLYLALGGSFSQQTVTQLDERSGAGQQDSACATNSQMSDCSP